jgi:hypothetical protein
MPSSSVSVLQNSDDGSFALKALCFRSQKKNESCYKVRVDFFCDPLRIEHATCDCPVGLGEGCGHIGGLLYAVANYQKLDLKAIPLDVVCTSKPKTWHMPRGVKIGGMEAQNVQVHSYSKDKRDPANPPKPISSTLYNPVRTEMPDPNHYISQ